MAGIKEKRGREFCEWCGERPAEHQIDNKDVFNYRWEENLCDQCFTRNLYDHGGDGQTRTPLAGAVINELDKEEQERLR